jgi:6,7-dimethyl-8-ribityllumazine synthase
MQPELAGILSSSGFKFAIVVARFNGFITDRLLSGALDAFTRTGSVEDDLEIIRVPGAWEMPVTVKALLAQERHHGIICLGAVIRGDTPHFDYVAGACAKGLAQLALESGVPVAFGVLTTNTVEQAIDRAGTKSGNKGFDAAMTAIEMANLMAEIAKMKDTNAVPS